MKQKIKYLAFWDCQGLECLFNISEWEKKLTWTVLKGDDPPNSPNPKILIMRAMANPQRFPEIYIFESSGLGEDEVCDAFKETPQFMSDFIRKNGYRIFGHSTERSEVVIK